MFPLTIEESQSNHKRKVCYINAKKLVLMIKKVRDHCHYNGRYRGAAHNAWNVNCEGSK